MITFQTLFEGDKFYLEPDGEVYRKLRKKRDKTLGFTNAELNGVRVLIPETTVVYPTSERYQNVIGSHLCKEVIR